MDILSTVSLAFGILVALGSVVGAIFKFVIIQPLQLSIERLADTVKRLNIDVEESRQERKELSIKVASIETDLKNAWVHIHHFLDLESRGHMDK